MLIAAPAFFFGFILFVAAVVLATRERQLNFTSGGLAIFGLLMFDAGIFWVIRPLFQQPGQPPWTVYLVAAAIFGGGLIFIISAYRKIKDLNH